MDSSSIRVRATRRNRDLPEKNAYAALSARQEYGTRIEAFLDSQSVIVRPEAGLMPFGLSCCLMSWPRQISFYHLDPKRIIEVGGEVLRTCVGPNLPVPFVQRKRYNSAPYSSDHPGMGKPKRAIDHPSSMERFKYRSSMVLALGPADCEP